MTSYEKKYFGNAVYHAVKISGFSIIITMILAETKIIKDIDVGTMDLKDALKLSCVVSGAIILDDYLVKSGFILGDILRAYKK